MKTKKLISLILSLSLVLGSVACSNETKESAEGTTYAVPLYTEEESEYEYTEPVTIETESPKSHYSEGLDILSLGDGTAIVIGMGSCSDTKVVIPPETPNGDKVTEIDKEAFANNASLREVTIPDSVYRIGYGAFSYCENLIKVNIPDSVTQIDNSAFKYCTSLQCETLPDSVTTPGSGLFEDCSSITRFVIPAGWTEIPANMFACCRNLSEVVIPDSVTSIGSGAFITCESLAEIKLPNGLKHLGSLSFSNSGLTSIVIPESLESTYFYYDGEYSYGLVNNTFESCKQLRIVEIPKHLIDEIIERKDAKGYGEAMLKYFRNCNSIRKVNGVDEGPDQWVASVS